MIEDTSIDNRPKADPDPASRAVSPYAEEPGRCATLWASSKQRLSAADLVAVHFFSRSARWRVGRTSAFVISKLGNGWLYPLLALMIFEHLGGGKAIRVIIAAGVNAGVLHCLYPAIKRYIGRPRPFRTDSSLSSLFGVLDEHSFPSGHAMTLNWRSRPDRAGLAGMLQRGGRPYRSDGLGAHRLRTSLSDRHLRRSGARIGPFLSAVDVDPRCLIKRARRDAQAIA